jgi:hypothetical protein
LGKEIERQRTQNQERIVLLPVPEKSRDNPVFWKWVVRASDDYTRGNYYSFRNFANW